MKNNTVCISKGNSKMGKIPSVSLPAVVTCRKNCTCAKECYALKIERIYKTARESYYRNLQIFNEDPAEFWKQVSAAMSKSDSFRFGVAGDVPNSAYFEGIINSCRNNPHCVTWMFTKQYEIVNEYLDNGGQIPENLTVIFSEWPDIHMDNPHNLPVAYVRFRNGLCNAPKNAFECTGNCYDCRQAGRACPYLKNREVKAVVFNQH